MTDPIYKMTIVTNPEDSETKTSSYVDGNVIFFKPSGKVSEIANYLMGMMHGEHIIYNDDGSVKQYSFYDLGVKQA